MRAFGQTLRIWPNARVTKRCEFGQMPRVLQIGQMRCSFGQMRKLVKCALHNHRNLLGYLKTT